MWLVLLAMGCEALCLHCGLNTNGIIIIYIVVLYHQHYLYCCVCIHHPRMTHVYYRALWRVRKAETFEQLTATMYDALGFDDMRIGDNIRNTHTEATARHKPTLATGVVQIRPSRTQSTFLF